MRFELKKFDALTPQELYGIIWLRNEVFVVEQQCVFQDADYKDDKAWHLMGFDADNQLIAYCRLLPRGVSYAETSIGRVVVHPAARRTGAGKKLMQQAIEQCKKKFGTGPIRIGAQLYLKRFYESFGFRTEGTIYLEDGIEHIEMLRDAADGT